MKKEYFGFGSVCNLKEILDKEKPKNIFLVTGKSSYEKSGAKDAIKSILSNYNITHFCNFEVNPKLKDIIKGIDLFKKEACDLVIGIGGGSVIDMAKSINCFANNPAIPSEYLKKEKIIENKGRSLIAIPTTSGSGSESTHFAVIYMCGRKYSLAHEFILPDYSIIDPSFTLNIPKKITASSGMDALGQAIESYWCVNSTDQSKQYASKAIKLVMNNLVNAANNFSKESREAIAKAAHLAGKAINITKTTVPHSISYPLTSHFGIPHGHAVSLTLPSILIYNSKITEQECLDIRGVAYVKKTINEIVNLLGCGSEKDAKNKLVYLMKNIGLETNLRDLGISNLEIIIKEGFNPDRVKNNPRLLTESNLREILKELF
ncbi:phosphonoacetaldehyde reductase [Candidatus Pacearchaeota archaeon]|nr:phosphonoacetaldehyde reductase [Candidatus Pacearchaeota archaeon]